MEYKATTELSKVFENLVSKLPSAATKVPHHDENFSLLHDANNHTKKLLHTPTKESLKSQPIVKQPVTAASPRPQTSKGASGINLNVSIKPPPSSTRLSNPAAVASESSAAHSKPLNSHSSSTKVFLKADYATPVGAGVSKSPARVNLPVTVSKQSNDAPIKTQSPPFIKSPNTHADMVNAKKEQNGSQANVAKPPLNPARAEYQSRERASEPAETIRTSPTPNLITIKTQLLMESRSDGNPDSRMKNSVVSLPKHEAFDSKLQARPTHRQEPAFTWPPEETKGGEERKAGRKRAEPEIELSYTESGI
eukprot:TRINITY_DN10623_c0_g1_i2.p1 TRINITY_DN10623_c0_g1~~TRINITY_DN10623_c0_g1_i2.p1  ORF type:complete len:308 (-),score=58.60 TRINITY_DN10623_c0_g1_i2:411-1334(-)